MKSVEQMKGNKTIKAGGTTAPQMSEWTGWMDGYPLDCYNYWSTCGANNVWCCVQFIKFY